MIETPWGYAIDEDAMPAIIDRYAFDELTGGRWAGDCRVQPSIDAVSSAVRDFCGWHVGPSCDCTMTLDGEPGDIWLPVAHLSAVSSVEVDGAEVEVAGFNRRGRIRLAQPAACGLGNVTVSFTAGLPTASLGALVSSLKDAVVAQVALTSYGISQETAGDVSISYSGSALSAQGMALPMSVRSALAPYRVVRAHAV